MLAHAVPLLVDPNPIQAPIDWILESIGSYLRQNVSRGAVSSPLRLLIPLGDPRSAAGLNPLARIVPSPGSPGARAFQNIAGPLQAVGYVLFAILLIARMLKLAATGRLRSPEHVLLDLAPKLVLGLVAMRCFDAGLNVASQVSMEGAFLLEDALLFPLHLNVDGILGAFPADGLGVVLVPALYVLVAYLVLLVITSRLVLLLGALVSPLAIPIAVQSEQGRLAGIWIRMLVSGLLVPVLAGIGAAGSLALAWLVHQVAGDGPFWGSYMGALSGECGLFFTALTATAFFKDAVRQGLAGVRGSFEGTQMGPATSAPGDAWVTVRRAAEAAAFVGMMAAAPSAAPAAATAVRRKASEPEAGSEEAEPGVLRLPVGRGGMHPGSEPAPPAPGEPPPASQPLLPAPANPTRSPDDVDRVGRYADHLSEPAGEALDAPELGRASEA